MHSAHRQSLITRKQKALERTQQSPNVLKDNEVRLQPGHRCIQFEAANNDETCWDLWDEWLLVCNFDSWDDECDAVVDAWLDQDLDWLIPEPIDTECMTYYENLTEDCEAQVDRMWAQCDGEGEYKGEPWRWTEACNGLEMMEEAFKAFDFYDECEDDSDCDVADYSEWLLVLNKKVNYKMRKNPAKYNALVSALMHKPTTAAID